MLSFKHSVRLRGIAPEMALAVGACERVYAKAGFDLVVTSATDGDHRPGSLHHMGCAVDLRLPPADIDAIVNALRDALGAEFDVVLEGDHIHVEYDP